MALCQKVEDIMKTMKDVKVGQIFNIHNSPSYPKIRTTKGYVDIRDNIINDSGNCNDHPIEVMSLDLLAKNYDGTVEEIKEWIVKQTGINPAKHQDDIECPACGEIIVF